MTAIRPPRPASLGLVDLHEATLAEADLIGALVDDYLRELTAHREVPVGATDIRSYTHLDSYWTDPGRHAFLIRSEGRVVGFALIRDPTSTGSDASQVAEFYIEPGSRRRGIGRAAAYAIWQLLPGPWELQVHAQNSAALEFWSSCVPAQSFGNPRVTAIHAADGSRFQYNFVVSQRGLNSGQRPQPQGI